MFHLSSLGLLASLWGFGDPPTEDLRVEPESVRFVPGKGLVFESRDGRFSLELRSRLQLRYEIVQDQAAVPEVSHSFQVRRARVQISGHVFGQHNKYKLQLALSPRDMQFGPDGAQRSPVMDAIVSFDYLRDFTVTAGQFLVPFNRHRLIRSGVSELVDRSIASGEFQLDRDVGIQAGSDDLGGVDRLRYSAGVFLGEGRDPFAAGRVRMLYAGRFEILPFGGARDRWGYSEADLGHLARPKLAIGGAYAYLNDASTQNRGFSARAPTDGGTTDVHTATADAVLHWHGLSLMGEFYWRRGDRSFGSAVLIDSMGNETLAPREAARDGIGGLAQIGYILPWAPVGIAGRFSQLRGARRTTSLENQAELGGGPSWYISTHNLKIQADYFRIWADHDIQTGQHQVRLQLSIGF